MIKKITCCSILLLIFACGLSEKEIGRLPINVVSTKDHEVEKKFSVTLKKGDKISFWSEMDVEYTGNVHFQFEVLLLRNDKPYTRIKIDPMDKKLTIGEIENHSGNDVKWSFTGRNTEIEISEDGEYTFKGIFIVDTDKNYKVNKAELILKQ